MEINSGKKPEDNWKDFLNFYKQRCSDSGYWLITTLE